tara:strand:- start:3012 stop:4784 length:1773 start_codon:yes stop_codon:yes gene_type:complete
MSSPIRPPLTVTEGDGNPSGRPINKIVVSNGTLTINGTTATITTGTGGGGSGTVTSVSSTDSFISISNPNTTPSITIQDATASQSGILTSTDWNTFNNKTANAGTVTSVSSTQAFVSVASPTTSPDISIGSASGSATGVLTSTDWTTFNNKGSGTIGGSIADTQVAVGSGSDTISGGNSLLFDGTTLTINTGSNDPIINLSNSTKSVSLKVATSQKLTIQGSSDTFVFDASSSTGGITFPDGTTQTTAASGGGVTFPIEADSGSSGAPSYAFSADTDTGIYLSGASNMGITAGGQNYLFIGSLGAVQFNKKALFNAASAAFPNGFAFDTNTGFFQPSADTIGFSTAGTERLRFGSSGEILVGGTASGTSGQVLTSGGASGAVSWTTVSGGGSSYNQARNPNGNIYTGFTTYILSRGVGFTSIGSLSTTASTRGGYSRQSFRPFIAPETGDVSAFLAVVSTSSTDTDIEVSIYNDNGGVPDDLIGKATIDCSSTGAKSQTTISSTISLTEGTQYWYAWVSTNAIGSPQLRAEPQADTQFVTGQTTSISGTDYTVILVDLGSTYTTSSSITRTNLYPTGNTGGACRLGIKYT